MHVKTLGYPIGCQPEIYNEDYHSLRFFIQQGDYIKRLNLKTENPDYIGTTDLIVKTSPTEVSSKYKALVYQGVFIGETAQTLMKNEFFWAKVA